MKKLVNMWISVMALALLAGCAGEFDLLATDSTQVHFPGGTIDEDGKPVVPGKNGVNGGDDDVEPEIVPITPGFDLERTDVKLLPFHIRMQNLARVTGLSVDDPLFDEIRARRYDLGDHNYGQGIGPDLNWNASKMAIWVEALRPVCSSEAMAVRYPSLPDNLNQLVTNAYGRPATSDDTSDFTSVLGSVQLSDADRYEAVCLSVLTSSEFVAQ